MRLFRQFLRASANRLATFILDNSQSDSIAFPSCLDAYATRLLTEPLIWIGGGTK
jgi:hypothetical protein